jgi:hypothetical protein
MANRPKPYHKYSREEKDFLEKNIPGRSVSELIAMFHKQFGITLRRDQVNSFKGERKLRSGLLAGAAPIPVGGTTMRDGHVYIKTADGKWKKKHELSWEEANGKIPKGHFIFFVDGNKSNCTLENMMLVSLKESAVMSCFHMWFNDLEMAKAGRTLAQLKLLIGDRKRGGKKKGGAA